MVTGLIAYECRVLIRSAVKHAPRLHVQTTTTQSQSNDLCKACDLSGWMPRQITVFAVHMKKEGVLLIFVNNLEFDFITDG